ncbi:MAG: polyhydroxyalkanoic acid system family protein [Proteobacteria bacterium]|nr:polyhydroxyalkanoic acid system family protein [Pseudomonadota bacterium]MBS0465380.1 polyhydroxyalkanoic acid system family protein [Pseudomonadota bacterium]
MATIDICHPHQRSMQEARAAVERVAAKIGERFGIRSAWAGDSLDFHGSGVKGRIGLTPKQVHFNAHLGFPVSMFAGSIEAEIRKQLDQEFD